MHAYLKRLQSERDSLTQAAVSLTETATSEDRDLTDTEKISLATMQTRCGEIDSQLTTYSQQLDSTRKYAQLRASLDEGNGEADEGDGIQRRAPRENRPTPPSASSRWGAVFIESAQFREYDGHGSSGRVDLPLGLDELEFETRAPIDLASLYNTTNPLLYVSPPPTIATPLIQAVNNVTTSQNTISVLTYPTPPPMAGVVLEGQPKPEANLVPVEQALALVTLAHWKGITRQALEDIPQIRNMVENSLRAGIATKIEQSIVDNLAAATLTAVGSTVDLANIRIGLGTVQAAGYPNANTVLLNPADWAALDIAVFEGSLSGPNSASNFWGLKAIASAAVPAGTAYVGDFKSAVTNFTRGAASVYLTDSHSDFFIRNILVLLAEVRQMSAVVEPAALAEIGTGTLGTQAASASKTNGK